MNPIKIECPNCQQHIEVEQPERPAVFVDTDVIQSRRKLRRRALALEWIAGSSLLAGVLLFAWRFSAFLRGADSGGPSPLALPALAALIVFSILLYFLAQLIHLRANTFK